MAQNLEKAKRYARIKISVKLIDLAVTCAYLVIFQFLASSFFKRFVFDITRNTYLAITVYVFSFSFILYFLTLPLQFYASFVIEHKFSLSNQSFFDWSKDELKKALLSFFIFVIIVQALYAVLRTFPFGWWVIVSVLWVLFTIVLANVMPTLILPLFYKYLPLDREPLKKRIKELAERSGIRLMDVYKIDFSRKTKKANAAVIGLGNTRRVILADNLIEGFPEEEIGVVVAHEFGHHKKRHVLKTIIFGAFTTLACFYILYLISGSIVAFFGADGIHDILLFPSIMLLFFIYGLVVLPLQNWYSRALEKDADRFALQLVRDKRSFISLMERLAEKNLADKKPSKVVRFFFYDHPPIDERIEFARSLPF